VEEEEEEEDGGKRRRKKAAIQPDLDVAQISAALPKSGLTGHIGNRGREREKERERGQGNVKPFRLNSKRSPGLITGRQ